jgi:hypothetical protein
MCHKHILYDSRADICPGWQVAGIMVIDKHIALNTTVCSVLVTQTSSYSSPELRPKKLFALSASHVDQRYSSSSHSQTKTNRAQC